jgi:undecaprenyl-diphosphatase
MATVTEMNRRLTLAIERARPDAIKTYVTRLDRLEIRWVQRQNRLTRHPGLRACAILVSTSAAGWVYLLVAIAVVISDPRHGATVVFAAGVSVALAQAVYAFGKSFVARPRPFASDLTIESLGVPLDQYSFPSGHSMTAAAVCVALGTAFPLSIPAGIALLVLVGWARIACAHHYPTDVVAGAALGASVALPVSLMLLW